MKLPPRPDTDAPPDPGDWLEHALAVDAAEHREQYIDDDGFTTRVMHTLPAPVAMPRWRKPALAALWLVAAIALVFALPGAALDVAREAFRLAWRPFTVSGVTVVLLTLAALTWAAAAFALRRD